MKKVTLLLILFIALVLTFSCAKKPPPGQLTEEEPVVIQEEEEGTMTEQPAETTAVETTAVETTKAAPETTTTVTTPPPPPAPTTVYSVQIGAFYSAAGANKRKARASSLLDKPVYVEYIPPYYKVRVGDFATKEEAESYKAVVTHYFYDAFVTETTKSP